MIILKLNPIDIMWDRGCGLGEVLCWCRKLTITVAVASVFIYLFIFLCSAISVAFLCVKVYTTSFCFFIFIFFNKDAREREVVALLICKIAIKL